MLDTRHLRYFLAVAEELHFGRAAERLGIAPPSLTQQIQTLERLLGAVLFHRTKRRVALSDAGALFLQEARAALQQIERAEQVGRRAGRGETGIVEVGIVTSATYTKVLASTVYGFRERHPEIELRVRELEMTRLLAELDEGRLDVGFVRPPAPYGVGIAAVTLLAEPILLALPERHPLARRGRRPLEPAALADADFITPDHGAGVSHWQHTLEIGARGGFTPRIPHHARNLFAVISLVALGMGIAVVPESLSACLRVPGVFYRRLAGPPILSELAAAFRRAERSRAARAFVQHLRAAAA